MTTPTEPQRFELPAVTDTPIRCKVSVFGVMEITGQVVLNDDGYAHFTSDDEKFRMVVHKDAMHVTAIPEHRASRRYDVSVHAGTEIQAMSGEGFKPLTYQGRPLTYTEITYADKDDDALAQPQTTPALRADERRAEDHSPAGDGG